MSNITMCPLCGLQTEFANYTDQSAKDFYCDTCGSFTATRIVLKKLLGHEDEYKDEKVKISCLTREQQIKGLAELKIVYASDDRTGITLQNLLISFPKSFSERADRVLLNLASMSKHTGAKIRYEEKDYPIFFVDDIGKDSVNFMIDHLISDNIISTDSPVPGLPCRITITSKGWNRVYDLQKETNKSSQQGFIAMWFNPEMNNCSKYLYEAISKAGYSPKRIDAHETNNKVCDEIIAEIRKSKFVVCDFTGQRGGVYFEAGFAYGLGLPVIWTCRQDWFESNIDPLRNTHFDVNHYNFIVWKTEEELYERVVNRIKATIV